MRSAKEIRTSFIQFFQDRGHTFVPSSPIVPVGDETLLFANAGMNQFKDIFLGLVSPAWPRAANSQKCLRVSGKHNDLEQVGRDTYHHTFFEMLGNWSFNDYFKAEAIEWAWQLLTEVWGLDAERLWATVFAGDRKEGLEEDTEAKRLWTQVTAIRPERVLSCGKESNFWEMGETGPCGPCSEIHIDRGPQACDKKGVASHRCQVNGDCARFMELWNLVFIQFNRLPDGKLVPLSARYVDTGAGLERAVAVMQGKSSNYDTDLFMPIIERAGVMAGVRYGGQLHDRTDVALRVIADHIRACTFAITDGATPSNDGRGYVIRRILRRASRFGRELGMHEPFLYRLVPVVVDVLGEAFDEIKQRGAHIATVIESEEASFGRTLDRGIELFGSAADAAAKAKDKTIRGEDAFQLYDTYGFPLDLTQLMAEERGLKVDTARFDELMEEQRQRARAAQKTDSLAATLAETELPVTDDSVKYQADHCEANVIGWIDATGLVTTGRIEQGDEVGLILDRTCFYAEAGGQVGDCGLVSSNGDRFVVETTAKIAQCVVHRGKMEQGTLSAGQKVVAAVSKDRDATKKNHTATHLLQWALQQVLGKSVSQQGSYVGPDYLRFDYTYPKVPSAEDLEKAERLVLEKIASDLPVTSVVMPKEQAQELGAMALFGEKYGSEVRVVGLGTEDAGQIGGAFSREFCGGTHVGRLGQIGGFKIIREESVSAGVRRITALTGVGLMDHLEKSSDIMDGLSRLLKVPAEQVAERVGKLLEDNKRLTREIKAASKTAGPDVMEEVRRLLEQAEKIDGASLVIGLLPAANAERGREAIDMLKKKAASAAVVLGLEDDGKAVLLAGVTDDLVKRGLRAGDIVKAIAPIIEGGGGGRPQMAEAGGKNPAKIQQALDEARRLVREKLSSR